MESAGRLFALSALIFFFNFGCGTSILFEKGGDDILPFSNVPVVRLNALAGDFDSWHASGIIIDETGIILTASHCLKENADLSVNPESGGDALAATPLPGRNFPGEDVAFLRITEKVRLPAAPLFGEKTDLSALDGETVYLKGYPWGNDGKVKVIGGKIDRMTELRTVASSKRVAFELSWHTSGRNPHNVFKRLDADCLFIRIEEKNIHGMSGGAVIYRGRVLAMISAQWQFNGENYAIAVPISRCLELRRRAN